MVHYKMLEGRQAPGKVIQFWFNYSLLFIYLKTWGKSSYSPSPWSSFATTFSKVGLYQAISATFERIIRKDSKYFSPHWITWGRWKQHWFIDGRPKYIFEGSKWQIQFRSYPTWAEKDWEMRLQKVKRNMMSGPQRFISVLSHSLQT